MTGHSFASCELLGGGQSVEDGHLDVHDDEVGLDLLGELDGLLAVARLTDDVVALLAEHLDEVEADQGLVLGDEDPGRALDRRRGGVGRRRRPGGPGRLGRLGRLGPRSAVGALGGDGASGRGRLGRRALVGAHGANPIRGQVSAAFRDRHAAPPLAAADRHRVGPIVTGRGAAPGRQDESSVPRAGLEPARPCGQSILSAPCLPFHHPGRSAAPAYP